MVSDTRVIGVDGPDTAGCGMEYAAVVEPAGLTGLRGFIPCIAGGITGILTGNNGVFPDWNRFGFCRAADLAGIGGNLTVNYTFIKLTRQGFRIMVQSADVGMSPGHSAVELPLSEIMAVIMLCSGILKKTRLSD